MQGNGEMQACLSPAFAGAHAWCNEKMMLASNLAGGVPIGEFFAYGGLEQALSTYAETKGGCDRRVAASMWSLYYFSALTIPYIVTRTLEGQVLPTALDTMTLSLSADGLPNAFGVRDPGSLQDIGTGDVFSVIAPLIEQHLAEAVAQLKSRTGIAPRLSWNNAAVYIDYALRAVWDMPDVGCAVDDLVHRANLPDGAPNPFHGCLRFEQDGAEMVCRRKVCCLRYQIPGVPSCGNLCALPSQRMQ